MKRTSMPATAFAKLPTLTAVAAAATLALLMAPAPLQAADRPMPLVAMDSKDAKARTAELRGKVKAAPADLALARELGILLHIANEQKRDQAEVGEAVALLKKVVKADPADHEAAAWLGSLITMQAEGESNPGKQTLYVKQGSQRMDKAVKAAPEDIPIRLIRAYNSLTLPKFLERTRFALEDFQFIREYCKKQECEEGRLAQAEKGLNQAKEQMN